MKARHRAMLHEQRLRAHGKSQSRVSDPDTSFWHKMVLTKIVIATGMATLALVPQEHQFLTSYAINLVWLWSDDVMRWLNSVFA